MSRPIRVRILGKHWTLEFARLYHPTDDVYGTTDGPDVKRKKIKIRKNLRGEEFLATTVHECLHAADWHKDEEWVEEVSVDIARVLCRQPVLERILDCPKLLNSVKHILEKHGFKAK